jgi:hypothetical protein
VDDGAAAVVVVVGDVDVVGGVVVDGDGRNWLDWIALTHCLRRHHCGGSSFYVYIYMCVCV